MPIKSNMNEDGTIKTYKSVEEMWEKMDEERAKRPWYIKIWDKPVYAFYRIKSFLQDVCGFIERFPQLIKRGWTSKDLWNLDETISNFIIPRLRLFRQMEDSCPEEKGMTNKKWKAILRKMIIAFKIAAKMQIRTKKQQKLYEEGIKLFAKYFDALWK